MYFSLFPRIFYDSEGKNNNFTLCVNIMKRVALRTETKTNALMFDRYDIREGETPEIIAYNVYGDSTLHWTILLANEITDRFHGWPMGLNELNQFVADKYSDVNGVHHYEIPYSSGDTSKTINIGDDKTNHSDATTVTNYEYELTRQDDLRKIRLIQPIHMQQFVEEFNILIRESVL